MHLNHLEQGNPLGLILDASTKRPWHPRDGRRAWTALPIDPDIGNEVLIAIAAPKLSLSNSNQRPMLIRNPNKTASQSARLVHTREKPA